MVKGICPRSVGIAFHVVGCCRFERNNRDLTVKCNGMAQRGARGGAVLLLVSILTLAWSLFAVATSQTGGEWRLLAACTNSSICKSHRGVGAAVAPQPQPIVASVGASASAGGDIDVGRRRR